MYLHDAVYLDMTLFCIHVVKQPSELCDTLTCRKFRDAKCFGTYISLRVLRRLTWVDTFANAIDPFSQSKTYILLLSKPKYKRTVNGCLVSCTPL